MGNEIVVQFVKPSITDLVAIFVDRQGKFARYRRINGIGAPPYAH